MKPVLTLEKVLNDVRQIDFRAKVLPKSFQIKGVKGPETLQEVDLPTSQIEAHLQNRRETVSREIDSLIRQLHPLRIFLRKQLKNWFLQVF